MRFARPLLAGLVALGTAACTSVDGGPTRAEIPPLAFVRYINAVPDTLNTTVRWVDDVQFTPTSFLDVAYGAEGQGGFQGLRAGSRHLRVFPFLLQGSELPVNGNTQVLADTTFDFVAGQYYSIVFAGFTRTGGTPAARLLILEDAPPASPAAGVLLRVYNLAYTTAAWDVRLGSTSVFLDTIVPGVPAQPGPPPVPAVPPVTAQKDTTVGGVYTAGQAGTIVASGSPASVETAVRPYTANGLGTFAARMFNQGQLTGMGSRTVLSAGLPETVDFESTGGTNINGSVITLWVFDRKTAGSPNSSAQPTRVPAVLMTVDRRPARALAP